MLHEYVRIPLLSGENNEAAEYHKAQQIQHEVRNKILRELLRCMKDSTNLPGNV